MSATQENFRLVGIRPHKDCSTKFAKVLTKGRLYKFYEEFEFYKSETETAGDSDEIIYYKKNLSAVPQELYKLNELSVNISAVVGKNGSGKSTLIELILYSIYKMGTTIKDADEKTVLRPYFEEIQDQIDANSSKIAAYESKISDIEASFNELKSIKNLAQSDEEKISVLGTKAVALLDYGHKINDLLAGKALLERQQAESADEHEFIHYELKCSVYFEINNALFEYSTTEGFKNPIQLDGPDKIEPDAEVRNLRCHILTDSVRSDILNSFFYTIVLNYSHYGLNSTSLGYWITTLFHKNDGYRTPAVINPMRTEGIIDINNENELAKARLLSNLLVEAFHSRRERKNIRLTDKQYIHKVRFTLDVDKNEANRIKQGELHNELKSTDRRSHKISDIQTAVSIIIQLLPNYFNMPIGLTELQGKAIPFGDEVCNYLIIKVYKILKKNQEYKVFKSHANYVLYLRAVLEGLKKDKSHVLFKIERALYYLSRLYDKQTTGAWCADSGHADFDLYELLDWMQISEEEDLPEILNRIPPSIFKIDFILDSAGNHAAYSAEELEALPRFSQLSSGEQQKIHIINGVVYHLNNLYSIHNSNPENKRIKYHYINVIFDEIELYFHPELQKDFIYDLLENIRKLTYINRDSKKRIRGLNFIFATHSPFILSDIPIQNIVKLQYDEVLKTSVQLEDGRQTFAANIHDLLANNFFFKDKVFIGAKADDFLKELIKTITGLKQNNRKLNEEESFVFEQRASLIGEKFFRGKLLEMIREQSDANEDDRIDALLAQKRKEIEELEKQKRNSSTEHDDTDQPPQPE